MKSIDHICGIDIIHLREERRRYVGGVMLEDCSVSNLNIRRVKDSHLSPHPSVALSSSFQYGSASVTSLDNYPAAHADARGEFSRKKKSTMIARDDNDYPDKFARASTASASACTCALENAVKEK